MSIVCTYCCSRKSHLVQEDVRLFGKIQSHNHVFQIWKLIYTINGCSSKFNVQPSHRVYQGKTLKKPSEWCFEVLTCILNSVFCYQLKRYAARQTRRNLWFVELNWLRSRMCSFLHQSCYLCAFVVSPCTNDRTVTRALRVRDNAFDVLRTGIRTIHRFCNTFKCFRT